MTTDKYYIYRIINTVNGHDYIGRKKESKTQSPLEDNYWGSGVLIKKAIKKYEKQNFKKEILESNLLFDDAVKREVYWIQKFKEDGKGYYNVSLGCEGMNIESISFDEKYLQEYNSYKSEKVQEHWANMSEEDYNLRTQHMKDAWAKRSPEEKEAFREKRSSIQKEVSSNLTLKEKQSIKEKKSESLKRMHAERSVEYQKEINDRISKNIKLHNQSLTQEQKEEISKVHSIAQKKFLESETEEHRIRRLTKQSLSSGKYYKLVDPTGNEFIIKALRFWCGQVFGEKGNSANTGFHKRGHYKGYVLLGECTPEGELKNAQRLSPRGE